MASKSILLLLSIFLVVTTKVFSYDEDLKIMVPSVTIPPIPTVAPPLKSPTQAPVKAPTPPPPSPLVKSPSPPVKASPPSPPPPYQSPPFSPPPVQATPPSSPPPPYQSPPFSPPRVKPPTPTTPPPPQSPVGKKPPVAPPPFPVTPAPAPSPSAPIVKSSKDCIPLCDNRCRLHSRKRLCMRACITCCERCKCVPPGTYGNREKCGKCYTDMMTHGNKYKCP